MPGYSFLNKKQFHPGTFKNIEKVHLAEEGEKEKVRLHNTHQKRLVEERYEEELKNYQVSVGMLPKTVLNKMDWMYNHDHVEKDKNIGEEYLIGKAIDFNDKNLHKLGTQETDEEFVDKNEQFLKLYEDPLFFIRKKALEKLGNNKNHKIHKVRGTKNGELEITNIEELKKESLAKTDELYEKFKAKMKVYK